MIRSHWTSFLFSAFGYVSPRTQLRLAKELGLYPRRGQQNKALLKLMKTIEAEIAERGRWATVAEEMQFVSYTESEV